MKLSYEDHGNISVVTLSGEFTADQTEVFRRSLADRFTAGARNIVLQVEHLETIDSAGLEMLLWLIDELSDRNGVLRLVKPDEHIRRIFAITRLEKRFNMHNSVESAAKSLR
jgi:anti-sigma B factor antagonist